MTATLVAPARPTLVALSIEEDVRAHGLRVGALAGRIARALGMTRESSNRLAAAAMPHDLGKTTIPPKVLLWPGPLDETQLAVVREHAVAGERLAQRFSGDFGVLAAAIARSHHERFDGKGYPDGLAGAAIPLAVAIVSVADVYDALTSDRAYRPAFSPRAAVAMMRRERGRQFAPRVLDAFLAAIELDSPEPQPGLEIVASRETFAPSTAFRYRRAEPRALAS